MIFHKMRHQARAHITPGAFIHCTLSMVTRSTQMALQLGWWFRWAVFAMETLELQNIFAPALSLPPIWGWGDLGSFQLPQSNSSSEGARNLGGYIFFLAIANYNGLPYLVSFVWLVVSETWCHWDMNVFYSDSKTDLKLWCDYCIKFQLFKSAQDIVTRLTAVLHVTTPQPLQSTPALQEACLWALL